MVKACTLFEYSQVWDRVWQSCFAARNNSLQQGCTQYGFVEIKKGKDVGNHCQDTPATMTSSARGGSRNPSRMSRSKNLVCRSVTLVNKTSDSHHLFNSPKLKEKCGNIFEPKLNICNEHHAKCGSCMDDDIHSQLLFENNSKSITYMNEIVLEYSVSSGLKANAFWMTDRKIILANLASFKLIIW